MVFFYIAKGEEKGDLKIQRIQKVRLKEIPPNAYQTFGLFK